MTIRHLNIRVTNAEQYQSGGAGKIGRSSEKKIKAIKKRMKNLLHVMGQTAFAISFNKSSTIEKKVFCL